MKRPFTIFLTALFLFCMGSAYAQPPFSRDMPKRPGNGYARQNLEKMKKQVLSSKTDSSNFRERFDFLKRWVFHILNSGNGNKVREVVPPGTLRKIRQMPQSDPQRAYDELDRIFAELDKIDSPRELKENHKGGATFNIAYITNPTSKAKLWTKVYQPPGGKKKNPSVILVPGALGYGSQTYVERQAEIISNAGFIVGTFDPDGRGKSGGREDWNGFVQQDGLDAFIKYLSNLKLVDRKNIGVVSLSYGLSLAAGTLARHNDSGVKYLIDVEGPADRFSITLNGSPKIVEHYGGHGTDDVNWWKEREPVVWVKKIHVKYLRIQSERDHTQPENTDAIKMIDAATESKYGGKGDSPWTRVNGRENKPNSVYTKNNPPKWIPGKGMVTPEDLLKYIKEMSS